MAHPIILASHCNHNNNLIRKAGSDLLWFCLLTESTKISYYNLRFFCWFICFISHVAWWLGGLVAWWLGGLVAWWLGGLVAWWLGGLVAWWLGGLVAWWLGGLVAWWLGGKSREWFGHVFSDLYMFTKLWFVVSVVV